MRTSLILFGAALLAGGFCWAAGDERLVAKLAAKGVPQPAIKAAPKPLVAAPAKPTEAALPKTEKKPVEVAPPETQPVSRAVAEQRSADELLIRQTNESFAKAYSTGDAKAVAAHFTTDAEYVDELGNVFQGRPAIEESLTDFFANSPDCKIEMNTETIRFLTPDVAVEDGSTSITHPNNSASDLSPYTTVHVKSAGKWLAASVRDHAPKNRRQHRAQLQQLEWLLGDWVDEGDDSIVNFSCEAVEDGNFLLRKFTIHVAGQDAMSGTQRIGWDPMTGKLRAWIFDSEGAYGEGLWHRDGDNWVFKSNGVTADGQTASSTSIYTLVNDHTITWKSVHHEVAGIQQPDSEEVTLVRRAPIPVPEIAAELKQPSR